MRKLAIYESKRLWEEGVSQDLDMSLDVLLEQSLELERYDYSSNPAAFKAQPMVAKFMESFGEAYLPLMLVDDVIVVAGRYPDDGDLINWLEVPPEVLGYEWVDEGDEECGCGCGHDHGHEEHEEHEHCCGHHHDDDGESQHCCAHHHHHHHDDE